MIKSVTHPHDGEMMEKWPVLIAGIGTRVVEAEDIDGAYAVAEAEYGCRLEDVLAVFSHDPFRESKVNNSKCS